MYLPGARLLCGVLVLVVCAPWSSGAPGKYKLPPELMTCSLNLTRPEYEECYTRVSQAGLIFLEKGSPSLGVLPIDPLRVQRMQLGQGGGMFNLNITLSNVLIAGFSKAHVKRAWNNMQSGTNYDMYSDSMVPRLSITADYSLTGQLLFLPITGSGSSNITCWDMRTRAETHNELTTRPGGTRHLVPVYTRVNTEPRKIFVHFGNLLGGERGLGRQLNAFLNENAVDLYQEFRPAIEETFGEVFTAVAKNVFDNIPYDLLFKYY